MSNYAQHSRSINSHKMEPRILTIQYLEDSASLAQLDPGLVIDKLRAAAERLPITHLLVGWHLPIPLLEALRREAERLGMRFIRWQPLLTGDRVFIPASSCQVVTLTGNTLTGFQNLPEFTFACPNHPAVQAAMISHIADLIRQGLFQGFFLDRVRFPSPAQDPLNQLTCFCEHCRLKAAQMDLDLEGIRQEIFRSTRQENGRISLVKALLSADAGSDQADQIRGLAQFIAFRKHSILDFLTNVTKLFRQARLEIGLDCFSPSLTHMVGQDLRAMGECADWVKLMTYAHTHAPAGLPFELSGLLQYLIASTQLSDEQVFELLGEITRLQLPGNLGSLSIDGLSSFALEKEVRRGIEACSVPVLAGIELVRLDGVTHQNPATIQADLMGIKRANPAGLALSWDLLHIPLEWLDLVRQVYLINE